MLTILQSVSKVVALWRVVQDRWVYIESLFRATDISRRFPNDAKMFAAVDADWRGMSFFLRCG